MRRFISSGKGKARRKARGTERPEGQSPDHPNENQLLQQIRQPLADELDWAEFLQVPFTHHVIILRKIKDPDERIFYIHQCATRAWSKYALRDFIASVQTNSAQRLEYRTIPSPWE